MPDVGGIQAEVGLERKINLHPRRHVDEGAAGPDSAVQSGELVVSVGDDRSEVLAEEIGVLSQPVLNAHEDDPLLLKMLVDLVVDHFGFILRPYACKKLLLGLRDPQFVERPLDGLRYVFP